MFRDIHAVLESHTSNCTVRRQLHAVPPHSVYEIDFDGIRAVCKLAQGPEADPVCEAQVIKYVTENTTVPVPQILSVGEDHFVAKWNEGVPEDPTLSETKIATIAKGLATLHTEAAPDFERTGLLHTEDGELILDGNDRWSDTLCSLLTDRRDYLDSVGYGDVAREVLTFVRNHRDLFVSIENPTLLHGNYLPEHVGVEEDTITCVIDFEHALVGPCEYDYLRSIMPIAGNSQNRTSDSARETFREAYESVRPLPPGFDRRWKAHKVVNMVSYLKALHLQRSDLDPRSDVARRAYGMRKYIYELLDKLRAELN